MALLQLASGVVVREPLDTHMDARMKIVMPISFSLEKSFRRRAAIGSALLAFTSLLPLTALALDPPLFQPNLQSLSAIQGAGGSCRLAGADCLSNVFTSSSGIEFKKSGFPRVSFNVTHNGVDRIDPQKGTITFNYTPLGAPDGDWGTSTIANKVMFFLHDPYQPISADNTLKLGVFYDSSTGNYFLYFRYDGTSNCTGANPQYVVSCYRGASSAPSVVMAWQPNVEHEIMAMWDLTAVHPYLALSIDGTYGKVVYPDATVGLDGFNPTVFYVGSHNGVHSAQGRIDNLKIYGEVALDPADPVPAYIEQTLDDGVWQPHETIADTTDAPAAEDLSGQPFIFYQSYDFEPIYEGSVPDSASDVAEIVVDVAQNQHQTAFFNIYAGASDLTSVETSVSNLTNSTHVIDQTKIKIRTVKNWWQAGSSVFKEVVPAYTPELLLYNDTVNPQCTGVDANSKPTCTGGLFPSDPSSTSTLTKAKAHTSRQFALTLDIPIDTVPGEYTGTITTMTNLGYKTLPIKVRVHDFALPNVDKIVALYNHNMFDVSTSNSYYLSESMYQQQLQGMKKHGVNGLVYNGSSVKYPNYAEAAGLTKFGAYMLWGVLPQTTAVSNLSNKNFEPYIYGEDEPTNKKAGTDRSKIPEQLERAKQIHDVNGKVVTAIVKKWADILTDSSQFPYTDELSVTYTFEEGKLDLPNLNVEDASLTAGAETNAYFSGLLDGTVTKAAHQEVYYWQMDREDPRINRYYTGYHLWLTGLDGVLPYVFQRLTNDPFNDFDKASSDGERDLNVIYPSLEGGIDTIEWEGFRAGVDDYRMLQLWHTLHAAIELQPGNDASARQATLDTLLTKYRNRQAFKDVTRAQFAADRDTLFAELDGMTADLADTDSDGIGAGFDNCPSLSNPSQADINGNGTGDACEHGLTVSYFNDSNTTAPSGIDQNDAKLVAPAVLQRIEANINFNYGLSVSPGSGVNVDYFSARFTGRLIVPAYTGDYEFCLKGDDGVRLWIDGVDLFGNTHWVPQDSVTGCATVSLVAGHSVPIKMEFFDLTEEAIAQLKWSWPGHTAEVVPSSNLYAQ